MTTKNQAVRASGPPSAGPTAPTVVLYLGGGGLAVGLILGLVSLGSDGEEVFEWINSLILLIVAGTSTGSALYARRAVKQTNGTLDARIRTQMDAVLEDHVRRDREVAE